MLDRARPFARSVRLLAPVLGLGVIATEAAETPAAAELLTESQQRVTPRQVLARSASTYPELAVVAAELDGAEALRSLAFRSQLIPTFKNRSVFGVVPAARGSVFDSPDSPRDLDDLGPFYRIRVDATLPLYTFGRIAANKAAASALVESKGAKRRAKLHQAYELGARAYFGYQLAAASLDIVDEVDQHLDDLMETLTDPEDEDEEPDPIDILRARNYGFELDAQRAAINRQLAVAAAGLRALCGNPATSPVRPATTAPEPLRLREEELQVAVDDALDARPDLRELGHLVRAGELRSQAASRERLPTLALNGRFEVGRADNRQKQDNPFIYEPFNTNTLTAVMVLTWDLSFAQKAAKARKSAAEAAAVRAKRDALSALAEHEIEQARARLVEARQVYQTSRRALSTAANWFRMAEEAYGLGTAGVKDVIDSYGNYIQVRGGQLKAIHDLNLAIVGWRLATGRDPLATGDNP